MIASDGVTLKRGGLRYRQYILVLPRRFRVSTKSQLDADSAQDVHNAKLKMSHFFRKTKKRLKSSMNLKGVRVTPSANQLYNAKHFNDLHRVPNLGFGIHARY